MPDVTPFELRRFGAALVLSFVALVCRAAVSQATEAEAPAASAASGDVSSKTADAKTADAKTADAAPKADAAKNAAGDADDNGAKQAGAGHRKDAAAKVEGAHQKREGGKNEAGAKPGEARAAGAKPGDSTESDPSLLTIRQAKDEADKEGRRNGARSKASDGTLIVWDKVNSVWVAPQPKNTYWVVDRFYQFNEGIWTTAKALAGPWEMTSLRLVPEAPRGRHLAPKGSVTAKLPDGVEAVYEPRIKVFKIAGRKGVFLNDGAFYRYDGGVWLESKTVDGPWAPTSSTALPGPLRRAITPAEEGTKVTLPSGEVLVSEGEPNLFAVEGKPDLLYFDGKYYERRDNKWFVSMKSSEGWEEISSQRIPAMVRSNYHKSDDAKGKKKAGERKAGDRKAAGKQPGEKKQQGQKKGGATTGAKKATKDAASGDETE